MNDLGHMIKIAAMPIYGKTPQKSSPELMDRLATWHVALMTEVGTTMFL